MVLSSAYWRTNISYLQGLKLYRAKAWAAARPHFESAAEARPEFAAAHFKIGMCFFRQKEWQSALDAMQTAVDLDPTMERWTVQRNQTLAYLEAEPQSSLKVEEEYLKAYIAADNGKAELFIRLANNLRKQGRYWQEIEALKSAIRRSGEDAHLHFQLGNALDRMRRFQEAAEAFSVASKLAPGKADYAFRMGFSYEREGFDGPANQPKSAEAYKHALSVSTSKEIKDFGIGAFHQKRGFWGEAAKAYREQIEHDPTNDELFYRLGLAHDRRFEWEEAERYITHSLILDHTHAYRHNRLGYVCEKQGEFEKAAVAYGCSADLTDGSAAERRYRQGVV